jgi:hypothetical protein
VTIVQNLNEEVPDCQNILMRDFSHFNFDVYVNAAKLSGQFLDHLFDRINFSALFNAPIKQRYCFSVLIVPLSGVS